MRGAMEIIKKLIIMVNNLNRGNEPELDEDHKSSFDLLQTANRKVGELETRLLQIESPASPQIEIE